MKQTRELAWKKATDCLAASMKDPQPKLVSIKPRKVNGAIAAWYALNRDEFSIVERNGCFEVSVPGGAHCFAFCVDRATDF